MDGRDGEAAFGGFGGMIELSIEPAGRLLLDGDDSCCGGLSLLGASFFGLPLPGESDVPGGSFALANGWASSLPAGTGATSTVLWAVVAEPNGFRICPPIPGSGTEPAGVVLGPG